MTGEDFVAQANALASEKGETIDPLQQLVMRFAYDLAKCEKENAELRAQIAKLKRIEKFSLRNHAYLAFCEICDRSIACDNADHARNNGWGIYNGQQFCPEHHAED